MSSTEENNKDRPYFISLLTSNNGGNSPKQVKEEYDYCIVPELYKKLNKNSQPLSYELLEKHVQQLLTTNKEKKVVIVTEDTNLPLVTVNTYSKNVTNVATIYISNRPKVILNKLTNIIFLGVDKDLLSDDSLTTLDENLMTYFTFQKIKQIGIQKTVKTIKNMLNLSESKKLHIIIDLAIIDQTVAFSVKRSAEQQNFLSLNDIKEIIEEIRPNISYMDVVGFDDSLDNSTHKYTKITGEVCRTIIKNAFSLKEKSMNIFTEDSRFLIYRPVEKRTDIDIGWYTVKFLTLKEREELLRHLIDKTITCTIDNYLDKDNSDKDTEIDVYVT